MSLLARNNTEENNYCYRYPHPAVTADCVIFGLKGSSLQVVLIERGGEPYKGSWALPGGFMRINETIEEAAARELREETNLDNVYMEQFKVYSKVDRDPRERVMTVAFIAVVRPSDYRLIAGDDAQNASWFDIDNLPPLAFDHEMIITEARQHLREILRIKPLAFEMLNRTFSMGELQKAYEILNSTSYDRRNFQRSVMEADILEELSPDDFGYVPSEESFTRGKRGSKRYRFKHSSEIESSSISPDKTNSDAFDNDAPILKNKFTQQQNINNKNESSTKGLFRFFNF